MNRFLTPSFWFDAYPLPFVKLGLWIFIGLFCLGVILGLVGLIIQKKIKDNKLKLKIWQKLSSFGFSFGIVGLILVFFKSQRIPFLGMRVWLILWFLVCLVWLVFILKYIFIKVPRLRKEKEVQKDKEKYIP